jgi:hypothetical protein
MDDNSLCPYRPSPVGTSFCHSRPHPFKFFHGSSQKANITALLSAILVCDTIQVFLSLSDANATVELEE